MLYSALIVAVSAAVSVSAEQSTHFTTGNYSTPISCCSVEASAVDTTTKSTWCDANQNTCVDLCGGQGNIDSNGNECTASTLAYICKCSNGTDISANMGVYQQSVPALMCQYWYGACINATGTDAAAQFQCETARTSACGNLTIDDTESTSSATSGSTASKTASGSASATGSSTASASAAASSGAAATLAQYGMPAFAGGLLAVFGLAL